MRHHQLLSRDESQVLRKGVEVADAFLSEGVTWECQARLQDEVSRQETIVRSDFKLQPPSQRGRGRGSRFTD